MLLLLPSRRHCALTTDSLGSRLMPDLQLLQLHIRHNDCALLNRVLMGFTRTKVTRL